MLKLLRHRAKKLHSLFSISLILFQNIAPLFFLVPIAKAQTTINQVSLVMDQAEHQLVLSGQASEATKYTIVYDDDDDTTPTDAVTGKTNLVDQKFSEKLFVGTCSTESTCIKEGIKKGTLSFENTDYNASFSIKDGQLWLNHNHKETISYVELGKTYIAPQNDQVKITFTKLPAQPGNLSIEEIVLSDEQVKSLGALSNIAYDITSNMENGSFAYDLVLPTPRDNYQDVEIMYAESLNELSQAKTVKKISTDENSILVEDLNHFTIFVVVQPFELATSFVDVFADDSKWFFYNDENDTIDNSLGSFVNGPATAPYGSGSIQISVSGTQRRNIATYQFAGTPLSEITELGFSTYNPSVGNGGSNQRSAYLHFNVDFNGSDSWQGRLVFLPPTGQVQQNTWQTWDAIQGGSALWKYSGSTWPVTGEAGSIAKTWSQILSDYPNVRIRVSDPWLGLRVGEPYNDGYTENIDGFIFGTSSGTNIYNFEPDVYGPTAPTITAPTENQYFNTTPILNQWTVPTDGSGINHYQIEYDYDDGHSFSGGPYRESTTNSRNHLPALSEQGGVSFRVRAFDNLGNAGAWSDWRHYFYDATPPAKPTPASPADGALVTGNPQQKWNSVSGTHHYEYESYADAGLNSLIYQTTTTGTSRTVGGNQTITIWWRVRAVDAAGNKSPWSDAWQLKIDNTKPSVPTQTLPANGAIINTNNFDFDWDDSSDTNLPLTYEFQSSLNPTQVGGVLTTGLWKSNVLPTSMIHSSGAPDGIWYWQVRAIDGAGNISNWSPIWTVELDHGQPTADIVFPTPGPSAKSFQVVFSEKVNPSDATNPANYYLSNWPGAGGSGDLAGDATITYDEVTKTATVTFVHANWYVSPEQLWGVQNIHDLAGNLQAVNPYQEHSTPMTDPVTTDSLTDSNWRNSSATVNLTCTDINGSGCKTTYYTTNGSEPTTASTTGNSFVLSTDGIYTIKYFSTDKAGNEESVKTAVNQVKIDTIAPTSVITSYGLTNGGTVETDTFTGLIEGTAADDASDIDKVWLSVAHLGFGEDQSETKYWDATNSAWVSTPSMFDANGTNTWSYQLTNLPEGFYTIDSHGVDNAGNVENTYQIKIVYDKTLPEVSLAISPTLPDGDNGWYRYTMPTISLSANDNYNVDKIEYQWNSTSGTWQTYSSPINPPGEGQNILYYRAVDQIGNTSGLGIKEVKYDATSPTGFPLNLKVENVTANTADASWEAPKPSDDVSHYRLSWQHEGGDSNGVETGADDFKHQLTGLYNGVWTLSVKAMDSAGNFSEAKVDFRVGPGPATSTTITTSSSSGNVLGTTTTADLGSANSISAEDGDAEGAEAATEEKIAGGTTAPTQNGEVLGETSSCSGWIYYLPLIFLVGQLVLILGIEFAQKGAGGNKLIVIVFATALTAILYSLVNKPECYGEGVGLATVDRWFVLLAAVTGLAGRVVGKTFFEE